MKITILAGAVLLAACGGTTATSDTTLAPATTVQTTTTTTTTLPFRDQAEIAAIEAMFTADKRVEICLMMLRMRNGGLPDQMIVDLGAESFREGWPDMSPAAEVVLRSILWECFQ